MMFRAALLNMSVWEEGYPRVYESLSARERLHPDGPA
jgi:hypothetical protein